MNAQGLRLYALGQEALGCDAWAEAVVYLRSACRHLPTHAAAHHLLGKALARVLQDNEAETLQGVSCELDPTLGWNWFALAELKERRGAWRDASEAYRTAAEALPKEAWMREKAIACNQRELLGGGDLRGGLDDAAYQFWCEQVEPQLPSELEPLEQQWTVLDGATPIPADPLPFNGWLVVLAPGARLRPQALQAFEHWLRTGTARWPAESEWQHYRDRCGLAGQWVQPDLITCDEDRLDAAGTRLDPWWKPSHLAESSWSTPWLTTLSVWRCSWLRAHGLGWPPASAAQREAWLWRALSKKPKHEHVPLVLVHATAEASLAVWREQQAQCVLQYLEQSGEAVRAVKPHPTRNAGLVLDWSVPDDLRCTVIVPTRDRSDLLDQCFRSVVETTASSGIHLDWILIDNGSVDLATARCISYWQQCLGDRLRVITDQRPFNWSVLNNQAASLSTADLLLFLNNDVEAIRPGWLERMVAQAVRPAVGCVGALLLYPDGSIQHSGIVVGMHGGADHAYRGLAPDHDVHRGRTSYLSDWGAVTGACLMVERSLFLKAGGFDPAFPVEFNDVDFCLRLGQQGYRHVVDPMVALVHHESQSRDAADSATAGAALDLIQGRWLGRMQQGSPWWPAACSRDHPDGRPLGLGFVRPSGPAETPIVASGSDESRCGHLDHLWSVGAGRYLLSGWSWDLSSDACLEWRHADGSWQTIRLGSARVRRPAVLQALGLQAVQQPDFGFLLAVEDCEMESCAVRIGSSEFMVRPHALQNGDPALALDRLIDACHWGDTPPERCAALLSAGLGQALCWLREQFPGATHDACFDHVSAPLGLLVELNDDAALVRCRLWQLQHQRVGAEKIYPALITPDKASVWGLSGGAPAWLDPLLHSTGLDLQLLGVNDPLPCAWVLRVGVQAPVSFLDEGLQALWLWSVATLNSGTMETPERFTFSAWPGVDLLRARAVSAVRAPLDHQAFSHRVTRSRGSWLRAVDRWLLAVDRAAAEF